MAIWPTTTDRGTRGENVVIGGRCGGVVMRGPPGGGASLRHPSQVLGEWRPRGGEVLFASLVGPAQELAGPHPQEGHWCIAVGGRCGGGVVMRGLSGGGSSLRHPWQVLGEWRPRGGEVLFASLVGPAQELAGPQPQEGHLRIMVGGVVVGACCPRWGKVLFASWSVAAQELAGALFGLEGNRRCDNVLADERRLQRVPNALLGRSRGCCFVGEELLSIAIDMHLGT